MNQYPLHVLRYPKRYMILIIDRYLWYKHIKCDFETYCTVVYCSNLLNEWMNERKNEERKEGMKEGEREEGRNALKIVYT